MEAGRGQFSGLLGMSQWESKLLGASAVTIVLAECREQAELMKAQGKPKNWVAAGMIVALWILLGVLIALWLKNFWKR